jgi:hypothetical protein
VARESAATRAPRFDYFADGNALRWHLAVGNLIGGLDATERRHWLQWLKARPDRYADAITAPGDMSPAKAAMVARLWYSFRHPRGFWRSAREGAS